jgi:hypothetical protein
MREKISASACSEKCPRLVRGYAMFDDLRVPQRHRITVTTCFPKAFLRNLELHELVYSEEEFRHVTYRYRISSQ